MSRRSFRSLTQICTYLTFIGFTVAVDQETCDQTKCPGPLGYYKVLGCTPVYKKESDCCATKYNCDHLKERSPTKCYVNGKEYEIGEKLREEDANPCDIGCFCAKGSDEIAVFVCAVVDCFQRPPKPNCYRRNSPLRCCYGEEICPENPEDRAICNVSGTVYKDGEYFNVEGEPDLNCVCQPGYEGKNIEPFCAKPKHPYCSPDFRKPYTIFKKCAPAYYSHETPQTDDCSLFSRCREDGKNLDETDLCHFGNMTMRRGDELNLSTDVSVRCVKCVCEVPPTPTCQRLSDEECDRLPIQY
ncbi:hypothetical protein PUN28_000241 [Cardiocondyla obscurior]|uniref:Kielin/chordin-like protein n=1 Tax=Cardiocondyla obscurior TaxID=286306 RepID=A0AAW2GYI1_9HYME